MTSTDELSEHDHTASDTDGAADGGGALEFHRLGRAPANRRWWRPLLVGVVAAALYAVLFMVLLILVMIGGALSPRLNTRVEAFFPETGNIDLSDPFSFVLSMFLLILLIPALWLAMRIAGARRPGMLSSVAGRLRWGWLGKCALTAIVVYAVGYLTHMVVESAQSTSLTPSFGGSRTMILLGLTLLLVPLQSAAEEYVFRGYLMQLVGNWLRHPAFAILLPVPLFVLGHDYGLYGMLDIAAFAVVAGLLTWRTGGLEAAVALHVVNNVSLFALAHLGLMDINATDTSLTGLLVSLLTSAAFAAAVWRMASRDGIQRTLRVGQKGMEGSSTF